MPVRKLPFARIKAIADMYRAGAGLEEVGVAFGLSHTRIRRILIDHTGVEMRPARKHSAQAADSLADAPTAAAAMAARNTEIDRLFRSGMTMLQIGTRFDLSRERVRVILRDAGTTARDGGASLRARRGKSEESQHLKR